MAAKFLNLECAYRYPVHLHKPHTAVINLPKYISIVLLYVALEEQFCKYLLF